jgi:hypothetical protein
MDIHLLVFLIASAICGTSLFCIAYTSPKRKIKMIGIKAECCKTGMAIQPVFENNDNTKPPLYWQCIHCHRIFNYVNQGRSRE